MLGQVGAFGILTGQAWARPFDVLDRAALPGAGPFGEVDLHASCVGELEVSGHLHALVPGQGRLMCAGIVANADVRDQA